MNALNERNNQDADEKTEKRQLNRHSKAVFNNEK